MQVIHIQGGSQLLVLMRTLLTSRAREASSARQMSGPLTAGLLNDRVGRSDGCVKIAFSLWLHITLPRLLPSQAGEQSNYACRWISTWQRQS